MDDIEDKYFVIQQMRKVKGQCLGFISPEQMAWRTIEDYQKEPLMRISRYCRNVEYTSTNTRTVQWLENSCTYLIQKIWPLLFQKNLSKAQRKRISDFLFERTKAIRCQYYVQGIMNPSQLIRILKIMIVLQLFKDNHDIKNELVGLQNLVDPIYRYEMEEKFLMEYTQALKYTLLTISKQNLPKLLVEHPIILQSERLRFIHSLRLKIQANNFYAYYLALERQQPIVKCLLWRYIQAMKNHVIMVTKKSLADVRRAWLFKMLGFKEEQGWINLKTVTQNPEATHLGYRTWISEKSLQLVIK